MLNKRLKELREEKDMTYRELAEIIGVSQSTIYRYENGKAKLDVLDILIRLADYFDVTTDYLLGRSAKKK